MSLEEKEIVEEVGEAEEVEVVEPELDDDGNPIEAEETPLWMQDEDEVAAQTTTETVPLAALMKQKSKNKAKEAELEELRQKVAALEKAPTQRQPAQLKRPRAADYDTEEEHEEALEAYDNQRDEIRRNELLNKDAQTSRVREREEAVDGFIQRADAVVAKHKINPETFKGALDVVQDIVERSFPGNQDANREFLSRLEPGDETTLYMIGRNKSQREQLEELFRVDPTGIKAFRHIAILTERNLGSKPKTSQAPKPAANANGNANAIPASERAWRKKYDAAPEGQGKYDIRKQAKAAGVKL